MGKVLTFNLLFLCSFAFCQALPNGLNAKSVRHRGLQVDVDAGGNITFFYIVDRLGGESDKPRAQQRNFIRKEYKRGSAQPNAPIRIWVSRNGRDVGITGTFNPVDLNHGGREYVVLIWKSKLGKNTPAGVLKINVTDQVKRQPQKKTIFGTLRNNYATSIDFKFQPKQKGNLPQSKSCFSTEGITYCSTNGGALVRNNETQLKGETLLCPNDHDWVDLDGDSRPDACEIVE